MSVAKKTKENKAGMTKKTKFFVIISNLVDTGGLLGRKILIKQDSFSPPKAHEQIREGDKRLKEL